MLTPGPTRSSILPKLSSATNDLLRASSYRKTRQKTLLLLGLASPGMDLLMLPLAQIHAADSIPSSSFSAWPGTQYGQPCSAWGILAETIRKRVPAT